VCGGRGREAGECVEGGVGGSEGRLASWMTAASSSHHSLQDDMFDPAVWVGMCTVCNWVVAADCERARDDAVIFGNRNRLSERS